MIVRRPTMSQGAARFYTALFSALTVLGVLAGGVYSILTYFDKRQEELDKRDQDRSYLALQNRTARIESQKPFFSKDLDLCFEISSRAATVATTVDPTKRQAAIEQFENLAVGPVSIVEDENVATKIAELENCLKSDNCQKDLKNLEALAVNIGHSCRLHISKNFDLNLAALPDLTTQATVANPSHSVNRVITLAASGSFQQGYALSPSSTVRIDRETGLVVSANIQVSPSGEIFIGAPVYNTDRMWQWQNQGSLGGSLDFQDQKNTFVHYAGGFVLTNSAYWTPSLGHIITSADTILKPAPDADASK